MRRRSERDSETEAPGSPGATADGNRAVKAAKKAAKTAKRDAERAATAAKRAAKKAAAETKAVEKDAAAAQREAAAATASVKRDAKAAKRGAKKANRDAKKAAKRAASAAKAASKSSSKSAAAAEHATKPARAIGKLTDPKFAKRAVTVGKVLAPVLAPVLLKAAAGTRGYLDTQRAHRLGVPVEQVGAYRGPTGMVGARIDGLTDAIRDLSQRKDKDLQITRFTEVASTRLVDLTAAVQASASMPRPKRTEVLRAVGRELDTIDADLVAHLMTPRVR